MASISLTQLLAGIVPFSTYWSLPGHFAVLNEWMIEIMRCAPAPSMPSHTNHFSAMPLLRLEQAFVMCIVHTEEAASYDTVGRASEEPRQSVLREVCLPSVTPKIYTCTKTR